MPEELTFEKITGNGCAVNRDHWAVTATALVVDAPRNQLLADSGFSENKDRGVGGCDRADLLQYRSQSLTYTNDFASVVTDRRVIGNHGRYTHEISCIIAKIRDRRLSKLQRREWYAQRQF
jgi:hypothetical protein